MDVKVIFTFIHFLIASKMAQAPDTDEVVRSVEAVKMSVQGHKLNGFKYKTYNSVSSLTCSQRCLSEFPKCLSYNHLSTMGESVCELNSKGISSMAEGLAGKLDKEASSVFVQLQSASVKYPSTCADHYKSGNRISGFYYIRYENDIYYRVYCDMQSEPNKVYTLIDSWIFSNRALPQFQVVAYSVNDPLSEDEPNWEKYRLSLGRMKFISSRSTHWRITCNFPQEGLNLRDYVRGKISEVDFLSFTGGQICKKVEFINLRGHKCNDCTVAWWQITGSYIFHHDSTLDKCTFGNTAGSVGSEDSFGFYAAPNTNFRCCSSGTSNTNVWLGSIV